MSTENPPLVLKDLTFSELIQLRDHFAFLHRDVCTDEMGVPKIDEFSIANRDFLKAEVEYLDRYIVGKYRKVKTDSLSLKKS